GCARRSATSLDHRSFHPHCCHTANDISFGGPDSEGARPWELSTNNGQRLQDDPGSFWSAATRQRLRIFDSCNLGQEAAPSKNPKAPTSRRTPNPTPSWGAGLAAPRHHQHFISPRKDGANHVSLSDSLFSLAARVEGPAKVSVEASRHCDGA